MECQNELLRIQISDDILHPKYERSRSDFGHQTSLDCFEILRPLIFFNKTVQLFVPILKRPKSEQNCLNFGRLVLNSNGLIVGEKQNIQKPILFGFRTFTDQ